MEKIIMWFFLKLFQYEKLMITIIIGCWLVSFYLILYLLNTFYGISLF